MEFKNGCNSYRRANGRWLQNLNISMSHFVGFWQRSLVRMGQNFSDLSTSPNMASFLAHNVIFKTDF